MAKLRYIPIVNDRDWVLISNLEALKNMVKAIKAEERDLIDEAEQWERRSIRAVEKELQVYMGDGPVGVPRIESRRTFGGGAVANVI